MKATGGFSNLSDDVKSDFLKLVNKLSPENLSCDGELSRAQTDAAYQRLMTQWRALEAQHKVSVDQDEVMQWQHDQLSARRSAFSI